MAEKMENLPVRILVVDDFAMWRQRLRDSFEALSDFQVVGEAADGAEAIQKAELLNPDLILLDVNLPGLNGVAAARRIWESRPGCKVLFFSSDGSTETVRMVMSAGGHGFLLKTNAGTELIPGVRAVLAGDLFLSSGVEHVGANPAARS